jgi:hypothetical protein
MAFNFETALKELNQFGLYDVLLPFFLVFAIFFGVLQRLSIFKGRDGKPNKKINMLIALAVATTFVMSPQTAQYLPMISQYFSLILIIFLGILLVLAVFGGKAANWIYYAILLFFIFMFAQNAGVFVSGTGRIGEFLTSPIVIVLGLIGLIVWLVTKESGTVSGSSSSGSRSSSPSGSSSSPRTQKVKRKKYHDTPVLKKKFKP